MAQPNPISLDPVQEQPTISLDEQTSPRINPETADTRARKAQFALKSTTGKSYDDIMRDLQAGNEAKVRQEAATQIDMQRNIQQRNMISDMAKQTTSGVLSSDQYNYLQNRNQISDLVGQPRPTDPSTVLEEYYAGEYLKPMWDITDQFNKGNFVPQAVKQEPESVKALNSIGETLIAKRQIAETIYQNARDESDSQSWAGWVGDQAKSLIPGVYEYLLRSKIGGETGQPFFGGLRGTYLRDALASLEGLPPDQYRAKLQSITDSLNPGMAVDFASAAMGQTTAGKTINDAFTVGDITALPGGAALKVARVGAIKLAESAAMRSLVKDALTDAVSSSSGPTIPLRDLVNRHFGEQSNRIDFELRTWRDQFKKMSESEGVFNAGNKQQKLNVITKKIQDLETQKKDLQSWHADMLANGAKDKDGNDLMVSQPSSIHPPVKAAISRGDLGTAATERVVQETEDELNGKLNPAKAATEDLPSFLDHDLNEFSQNPGHGGSEIKNRVVEQTTKFKNDLLTMVKNVMRVQRVPSLIQDPAKWTEAIRASVEAIKNYTREQYPAIRNSILNISNPRYQALTNTYHLDMIIGTPKGEYFQNRLAAFSYAKKYGIANPSIEKDSQGWFIRATKPLDETSHVVRDMLLKTVEAQTPDSWLNAFLGWARTPEETLSFENRMQRKIATYNASKFMDFAKETARDIGKNGIINKKQWEEWERAVAFARDDIDPVTNERGHFFENGMQLDAFYQSNFGRLPSLDEKSAYFAFKRINEYDRVLRSLALYRNKSRVGVESHRIWKVGVDGKKTNSDFFDGVAEKSLPANDAGIIVMGKRGNILFQGTANRIPPNLRKRLGPAVNRGEQKVIQIYDPETRPLEKYLRNDARIRYVVTENSEAKPINLTDQVPRRGGGHFEYDYDSYVKQPIIKYDEATGRYWYEGDRTLFPMSVRGMGRDVVQRLEAIRELLNLEDFIGVDRAKALHASDRGLSDIPWDEFYGWFKESKGANGETIPPRLSTQHSFYVVNRDQMVMDIDNNLFERYPGLQDGTRQGSLARQHQVQYTGQRDAYEVHTLNDIGTRHNPLYSYEPAKLVDPITTMNRALSRIVNSTFMDDYKIFSVEHWMREARPYFDVHNLDELDRSPFYYFNHADEYLTKGTPEIRRQLMSNRFKIRQLVGQPNSVDQFLHSAQQSLVDSIYGATGPKSIKLTPSWLLPSLKDPFQFVRSFVFNAKMGLFSIPQYFVHAMTTVNAIGIAGARPGFQGVFGAFLHGMYHINPGMLDHLDGLASKFFLGWKPGEFKESIEAANRTGFMNVAGEHAFLDTPLANRVVQTKFNSFLEAGQMFFRGGVTSLRAASWHMAYKEFRRANPTGRITDDELKRILERADILSHNMTRASTSVLTQGAMSIPAQFYTYQLRLFELMTGSRLTTIEKARLFGTNMMFFGLPAALGLGLYPFGDTLRNYAEGNGYVVGDKFLSTTVMEGIPAMILNQVTGSTYNVGGRYGAQGVGALEDIWDGDKTMWDILGGATYSTMKNLWTSSSGFRTAVLQAWRGEGDYQLTVDDAVGPFKEISSINNIYRAYAGINFGNWVTKNGAPLYETSPANAIFQAITGLSEQQATDVWHKSLTLKEHRAYDDMLYGQFQKEFTLASQAVQNKDTTAGQTHLRNAFAYLNQFGYPVNKIPEAIAAAYRNNQSIIDRVNWELLVKDPRSQDLETYNRIQALKEGNK